MTNEIGGYADWPAFVAERPRLTGDAWTNRVADLLGVPEPFPVGEVREVRRWVDTGVACTELAWPVGFGPEIHAWLLHPDGVSPAELPGVLLLHSHGGIKSIGAARLVAGLPEGDAYRARFEGGVAFANRLAARGATVLAPDAFSWGSRRFVLDPVPDKLRPYADLFAGDVPYDVVAGLHEHLLAKYCGVLGTSYAGMVAHDDLTALAVLRRYTSGPMGVTGFSGGGGRTITLSALEPVDRASVAGMMATSQSLVPDYVATHSWLLHTPGLAVHLGLPEMAANRAGHALQVIYGERDELFPYAGMRAADERLGDLFSSGTGSYDGVFVDQPHAFPTSSMDLVAEFLLR